LESAAKAACDEAMAAKDAISAGKHRRASALTSAVHAAQAMIAKGQSVGQAQTQRGSESSPNGFPGGPDAGKSDMDAATLRAYEAKGWDVMRDKGAISSAAAVITGAARDGGKSARFSVDDPPHSPDAHRTTGAMTDRVPERSSTSSPHH